MNLGDIGTASAPSQAMRILLVEDDVQVRMLTKRILMRQGWEIVAVDDGPAAIAAWPSDELRFDLVIIDLNLPGMNGYEVYRIMAAGHRRARFLFVSGHMDLEVWTQLFGRQAPPLLTKPFDSQTLIAKVSEIVSA